MIDRTLLELLPPLRRARGDRLYGPQEGHWVDLWKQNGVWLLGHRPEGAAKEWKNQVDKGLACWAPSLWPRRLEPLVGRLLPGTLAVRVFRNEDRVNALPVWRPWDGSTVPDRWTVFRVTLPTGPGQAVAVAHGPGWTEAVPDSDVVSPAEAACLVRAATQLLRYTDDPRAQAERRVAIETFDRQVGDQVFERSGLWFRYRGREGFGEVFRCHLEGGFLLNPDPEGWNVIPVLLSPGEWAAWKAVVGSFPGGL